jgi:hypothetical protein
LSLNKCFEKIENPTNGSKKGCLWALNPDKCKKLEDECKRCRQRDPINIRLSMSRPDDLNKIERGEQRIKKYSNTNQRKTIDSSSISSSINSSSSSTNFSSSSSSSIPNANTDQQLINNNNDSFLLEWANNKSSTFILKEEVRFENPKKNIHELLNLIPIKITKSTKNKVTLLKSTQNSVS